MNTEDSIELLLRSTGWVRRATWFQHDYRFTRGLRIFALVPSNEQFFPINFAVATLMRSAVDFFLMTFTLD